MTRAAAPTDASAIRSAVNSRFTLSLRPAPILYPTTGIHPAAIPTTIEITIWKNFMTMPTTAIGICAYCACPKITSMAPYFRIILLMAAIAATREIWERKLVTPSTRVFFTISAFNPKSAFKGLIIFICMM